MRETGTSAGKSASDDILKAKERRLKSFEVNRNETVEIAIVFLPDSGQWFCEKKHTTVSYVKALFKLDLSG